MIQRLKKTAGGIINGYRNKAPIEEIVEHISEQGEHLIMIENGLLKEKVGEQIPKNSAQKSITIHATDIKLFLEYFLKTCHSSHINTGVIGFDTSGSTTTIYGGPVSLRLIRNSVQIQKLGIIQEVTQGVIEETKIQVAGVN